MRIGSHHVKSKPGLRIGELSACPKHDCFKVRPCSCCQRLYQGPIGCKTDLAQIVVRESLREVPDLVGIELFIAVSGMVSHRLLQFRFGCADPDVAGLLCSLAADHRTNITLWG